MNVEIDVQYGPERMRGLPSRESIESWVRAALKGRRDAAQVVVRIVDEHEGRQLNERYRGRRGPTNVLSFGFDAPVLLDPPLLGDVVVCAPVVEHEAREQGKACDAHWAHMVVHGVLHLSGHDHENDRDAGVMEALETEVLGSLGFPDPYAADGDAPARRQGTGQ